MKTIKKVWLVMLLFAVGNTWSQEQQAKEKRTIKEVDQVQKTSEEINETTAATTAAVKSTVANTKETLKEVGSLFGSGKNKKDRKNKEQVMITIQQIDYDNDYLAQLYDYIEQQKGVKNPSKTYSKGHASISITFKEGADALWQTVPKQVRNAFELITMDRKSVLLQFSDNP